MTAGSKFRPGWLCPRADTILFPSKVRVLYISRQPGPRAASGTSAEAGAGACPYLPKLSLSLSLPAITQMFSLLFSLFQSRPSCPPVLPAKHHILGENWRQAGQKGPVQSSSLRRGPYAPRPLVGPQKQQPWPGLPHLPGRLTLQHAPVGRVGDGIDVRRHLVPLLALVHFDDLL